VGTYGYMAPEQFRGQAVLSTDLYGLGTTLLFLLTRKSPADLPQRQLKIDFRPYVRVNQKFANWLDKMLEPASEDRFSSAREALAVLQGEQTLPKSLPQPLRQPEYSPITLTKDGKKLIVRIPCVGLRSDYSQRFGLIVLLWNGILALMVWAVVALSLFIEPSRILIFIGFALIGLWMLRAFLYSALSSTQIEIDPHNFRIQKWLLGWRYENIQGYTANIKQVNQHVIAEPLTRTLVTVCVLKSKSRQHDFGLLLTQWEKDWLVEQIRYALFGRN
ncbi:MAG TPA: serine/threonine protein kinase, partial [Coleofasciculaceae cyanobacterium]